LKPHPGEWTKSYRWIRRTYARDGVPFYVDDVYIDASLARHATRADFGRKTARELLNQVLPPQPIRRLQTLTIRSADFETAGLLQVPLNAPVLLAERTRIDRAGRILMVGRGTYRAEAVRLDYQDEELHTRQ
jgi:GntR family transcriptional regulator